MDRVSNLPDEVLCHILSFLTTKEAALTSVLSKRWLNLFALVPDLDFDDSVFLHLEEGKRERDGILESFMDFVDRVLALQIISPIKKVSIKCETGVDSDRVDGWICNVLARGVSDLDLRIVFGDRYWLSAEGFQSEKLVKLKIASGIELGWWSDSIYLPMLKTLILESVEFCGDKLEMLLPSCPSLEELAMFSTKWVDSDTTVSSASLKTLKIKSSGYSGTLSFDTPNLVHFAYSDSVAKDYPLANFENISEARINLLVSGDWLEDHVNDVGVRLRNVAKLMNGLRNVHTLYLTSTTLLVLSICCESMPVFNNLKFLGFRSDKDWSWETVPFLLKNSPHLETLSIMGLLHKVTDSCGDVCDCISREEKGPSLRSCPVKKLEIQGFRGTMREINMIRHFLDYFPCLKEIDITTQEVGFPMRLDAEITQLKVQMMELYEKSLRCNVYIEVCEFLFMKLTAQ